MASWPQPVRLYTTHQMFRYDRPQKGRYRQHTQFDCEVLGSTDPLVDAEVIDRALAAVRAPGHPQRDGAHRVDR